MPHPPARRLTSSEQVANLPLIDVRPPIRPNVGAA